MVPSVVLCLKWLWCVCVCVAEVKSAGGDNEDLFPGDSVREGREEGGEEDGSDTRAVNQGDGEGEGEAVKEVEKEEEKEKEGEKQGVTPVEVSTDPLTRLVQWILEFHYQNTHTHTLLSLFNAEEPLSKGTHQYFIALYSIWLNGVHIKF